MLKKAYNQGYEDASVGHVNDADEYSAEIRYILNDYLDDYIEKEGFDKNMKDAFIMGVRWALDK